MLANSKGPWREEESRRMERMSRARMGRRSMGKKYEGTESSKD